MARAIKRKRKPAQVRVGAHVFVSFGHEDVPALVVEDMGPIGVRKRQLVRVRLTANDETLEFDMPADELKSAESAAAN